MDTNLSVRVDKGSTATLLGPGRVVDVVGIGNTVLDLAGASTSALSRPLLTIQNNTFLSILNVTLNGFSLSQSPRSSPSKFLLPAAFELQGPGASLSLRNTRVITPNCSLLAAHQGLACQLAPSPNITVLPGVLRVSRWATAKLSVTDTDFTCTGRPVPPPCLAVTASSGQELLDALLWQDAGLRETGLQAPPVYVHVGRDVSLADARVPCDPDMLQAALSAPGEWAEVAAEAVAAAAGTGGGSEAPPGVGAAAAGPPLCPVGSAGVLFPSILLAQRLMVISGGTVNPVAAATAGGAGRTGSSSSRSRSRSSDSTAIPEGSRAAVLDLGSVTSLFALNRAPCRVELHNLTLRGLPFGPSSQYPSAFFRGLLWTFVSPPAVGFLGSSGRAALIKNTVMEMDAEEVAMWALSATYYSTPAVPPPPRVPSLPPASGNSRSPVAPQPPSDQEDEVLPDGGPAELTASGLPVCGFWKVSTTFNVRTVPQGPSSPAALLVSSILRAAFTHDNVLFVAAAAPSAPVPAAAAPPKTTPAAGAAVAAAAAAAGGTGALVCALKPEGVPNEFLNLFKIYNMAPFEGLLTPSALAPLYSDEQGGPAAMLPLRIVLTQDSSLADDAVHNATDSYDTQRIDIYQPATIFGDPFSPRVLNLSTRPGLFLMRAPLASLTIRHTILVGLPPAGLHPTVTAAATAAAAAAAANVTKPGSGADTATLLAAPPASNSLAPYATGGLPLGLSNFTSCLWTADFDRILARASAAGRSDREPPSPAPPPPPPPRSEGRQVRWEYLDPSLPRPPGLPWGFLDSVILLVPERELLVLAWSMSYNSTAVITDPEVAQEVQAMLLGSRLADAGLVRQQLEAAGVAWEGLEDDGRPVVRRRLDESHYRDRDREANQGSGSGDDALGMRRRRLLLLPSVPPSEQGNDSPSPPPPLPPPLPPPPSSITFATLSWCGLSGRNVTLASHLPYPNAAPYIAAVPSVLELPARRSYYIQTQQEDPPSPPSPPAALSHTPPPVLPGASRQQVPPAGGLDAATPPATPPGQHRDLGPLPPWFAPRRPQEGTPSPSPDKPDLSGLGNDASTGSSSSSSTGSGGTAGVSESHNGSLAAGTVAGIAVAAATAAALLVIAVLAVLARRRAAAVNQPPSLPGSLDVYMPGLDTSQYAPGVPGAAAAAATSAAAAARAFEAKSDRQRSSEEESSEPAYVEGPGNPETESACGTKKSSGVTTSAATSAAGGTRPKLSKHGDDVDVAVRQLANALKHISELRIGAVQGYDKDPTGSYLSTTASVAPASHDGASSVPYSGPGRQLPGSASHPRASASRQAELLLSAVWSGLAALSEARDAVVSSGPGPRAPHDDGDGAVRPTAATGRDAVAAAEVAWEILQAMQERYRLQAAQPQPPQPQPPQPPQRSQPSEEDEGVPGGGGAAAGSDRPLAGTAPAGPDNAATSSWMPADPRQAPHAELTEQQAAERAAVLVPGTAQPQPMVDQPALVLLAEIGRGAQGVVYAGRWRGMDVAVKSLLLQPGGQPAAAKRLAESGRITPEDAEYILGFSSGGGDESGEVPTASALALEEAVIASRLSHPNIVACYTFELTALHHDHYQRHHHHRQHHSQQIQHTTASLASPRSPPSPATAAAANPAASAGAGAVLPATGTEQARPSEGQPQAAIAAPTGAAEPSIVDPAAGSDGALDASSARNRTNIRVGSTWRDPAPASAGAAAAAAAAAATTTVSTRSGGAGASTGATRSSGDSGGSGAVGSTGALPDASPDAWRLTLVLERCNLGSLRAFLSEGAGTGAVTSVGTSVKAGGSGTRGLTDSQPGSGSNAGLPSHIGSLPAGHSLAVGLPSKDGDSSGPSGAPDGVEAAAAAAAAPGLPAVVAVHLALHVARGMSYLHACGVVHGDLSSANVLLNLRREPPPTTAQQQQQQQQRGGQPQRPPRLQQHALMSWEAREAAAWEPVQKHSSWPGMVAAQRGGEGRGGGAFAPSPALDSDPRVSGMQLLGGLTAKICDFGLSRRLRRGPHGTDPTHVTGPHRRSSAYSAPEVVRDGHHGYKQDVYAFGVVLWELACGLPLPALLALPACQGVRQWLRSQAAPGAVAAALPPRLLAWPAGCPEEVVGLVERCVAEAPAERPSFEEVVGVLERLEAGLRAASLSPAAAAAMAVKGL